MAFEFKIEKEVKHEVNNTSKGDIARAGVIHTDHGDILTPAFITVGTKATVKSLSPEQVSNLGAQAVLANTYHLYLEPGDEIVKKSGGLHKFMNWNGPTFTDSGGFQAFSLGAGLGKKVSKVSNENERNNESLIENKEQNQNSDNDQNINEELFALKAKVTEDGVLFKSIIDGSSHIFTPERSMEIQHNIGADIIFAFDECTSPHASYEYQKEAMDRTHRWAERSLDFHKQAKLKGNTYASQALFGIVQGGRYRDLRKQSAEIIGGMDFPGFGIGGSFDKEDMHNAVGWVNSYLPKDKPKHLLGIGEPVDMLLAIEKGVDTFDCVAPTRIARNGGIYTKNGRINILNSQYRQDFSPIEQGCDCYTCKNYTKAYIAHLFRSKEMFAASLASIHNLYFVTNLVKGARQAILSDSFDKYKEEFIKGYK
jgi:queuine tRNA-ribosyltransferase